jgi:tetratricopeptide (TPR) repeat protein
MIVSSSRIFAQTDSISGKADKFPEFPGGMEKYEKFIKKNKMYPEGMPIGDDKVSAHVSFKIDSTGMLSDFSIDRPIGDDRLDKEAFRLLTILPKNWTPASRDGKNVNVILHAKIHFEILESHYNKTRNNRAAFFEAYHSASENYNSGNYAEAKKGFLKSNKLNPYSAEIQYKLGNSYLKLNNKDSACVVWTKMKNDLSSTKAANLIQKNCN